MRIPKPNPTLILAVAVLCLALSGTALAATAAKVSLKSASSANTAAVTKVGQLLTAPAPLGSAVNIIGNPLDSTCEHLYTVPAGKSLVILSATFLLVMTGTSGGSIDLYSDAACQSSHLMPLAGYNATSTTQQMSVPAGLVVPAGSKISSRGGGAYGSVILNGYLVPSAQASVVSASVDTRASSAQAIPPRAAHR